MPCCGRYAALRHLDGEISLVILGVLMGLVEGKHNQVAAAIAPRSLTVKCATTAQRFPQSTSGCCWQRRPGSCPNVCKLWRHVGSYNVRSASSYNELHPACCCATRSGLKSDPRGICSFQLWLPLVLHKNVCGAFQLYWWTTFRTAALNEHNKTVILQCHFLANWDLYNSCCKGWPSLDVCIDW